MLSCADFLLAGGFWRCWGRVTFDYVACLEFADALRREMNLTNLKSIVVLNGRPNSGKTAILTALCNKMANSPYMTKCNPNEQVYPRKKYGDQRFAAVYRNKKVAVCTAGDDANCILKAFLYAEKVAAEVLVVALSIKRAYYRLAEVAFDEIVAKYKLTAIVDNKTCTTFAPPKKKGYVDVSKVNDLFKKL